MYSVSDLKQLSSNIHYTATRKRTTTIFLHTLKDKFNPNYNLKADHIYQAKDGKTLAK
jgi:hypothetical protein